ncbi:general odorant-binding protein 71 [Uranotaenia lowii]|uniref:general odorant-binding protein 71 n=1 Tax=Uranotaenia lowii TaxID=190385 RepID=UPI0024783694|nr:general odorant-binding protein 71 [Uranotaenia lowii]
MATMVLDRPVVCLLVLVILLFLLEGALGLKCRTEDGPSSEEVRRVIKLCMKRIATESKNRSSDEYEDYDSSYDDEDDKKGGANGKGGVFTLKNMTSNGGQGQNRGRSDGRRDDRRRTDRTRDRDRTRGRDYPDYRGRNDYDYGMRRRGGYGNGDPYGQPSRYKRQYYNDVPQYGYGGYNYQQNVRYNQERNNFMNNTSSNTNSNSSNNATDAETQRDRACLMQCFFQEMKMTNNDGVPEKQKVLQVVTKDLRSTDLREFYTDSIQECFNMIGLDNKLKEKCEVSLKFVTCLADRGQANCDDWENETILF